LRADCALPALQLRAAERSYFSEAFTEVNLPLNVDPMPLTAATITMLIPPAMIAYSIAVAPS